MPLAIAGLVPTEGLNAARIAYIDMEADGSGRLTESVSGASLDIYGNFVPENIPGAVGKALRFDGYTTYVSGDLGQIGASDIEAMTAMDSSGDISDSGGGCRHDKENRGGRND